MNPYLKNVRKIEFVLTYACTGRCKHCSEGDHKLTGERIDPVLAAESVRKIAAEYDVRTVMVFGGEPLLHTEAVYAVLRAAAECGVERRQIITNGFFTESAEKMNEVALRLAECKANDLLLSVDAFHQQTIPLSVVRAFAEAVKRHAIPIRLQPAWLVSATDDNPYDRKTREILGSLHDLDLPIGEGNLVFPEGNALRYFGEYFTERTAENPYEEDPFDVRTVSVEPNGDVLGGNLYRQDIMQILENYRP